MLTVPPSWVLSGLANLLSSACFKLAKEDQRREILDLTTHFENMRNGGGVDMNFASPISFCVVSQNRMQWLYTYDMAPSVKKGFGKYASSCTRGPAGWAKALQQLQQDNSAEKPWPMQALKDLKPWLHT